MPYSKMDIQIERELVLKNLGYKDLSKVTSIINDEINKAIDEAVSIMKPIIFFKTSKFKIDEKENELVLIDGSKFTGNYVINNLRDTDYVLVGVSTLGEDFDKFISDTFESGNYAKAMILDSIGVITLNTANNKFWLNIAEDLKAKGLGISKRLCPGNGDWSIEDQASIFNFLKDDIVGITLNSSYMMSPVKSDTMVYGIGKNINISKIYHECADCNLKTCTFRNEKSKILFDVKVIDDKKEETFKFNSSENLFHGLIKRGVVISNACGGNHTCGKCLVKVIPDKVLEITDEESKILKKLNLKDNFRVSCFVNVTSNMTVILQNNNNDAKISTSGFNNLEEISPRIKKITVKPCRSTLENQKDTLNKIIDASKMNALKVPYNVLKSIPSFSNDEEYIDLILRGNELLRVRNININTPLYGIAVDIGTTTVVYYLCDLSNGKEIDVYSCLNPQKAYGADVITRIDYTMQNPEGLNLLSSIIQKSLKEAINILCKRNKINNDDIYEITIVGNTTMLHLFLGVNCIGIANAPYIPAFSSKMEIKAKELKININEEGYIILLPSVASYVGADTIAAVIASDMYKHSEISLLLDIGTNGEIVLGNKNVLICCSAAAGPAFEGAKISFGVGGVDGAIDHINICNGSIKYTTIGNKEAIGICGSGIVDAISEMLNNNIIDETGKITKKEFSPLVIEKNNGISVTQGDVRELQLAKSAICAGVNILIKNMNINTSQIKNVYFAGGFGNYISINSAVNIGLIPRELKDKVKLIGNGAGEGAKMSLVSDQILKTSEELKLKMKYLELSTCKDFQNEFMDNMYFK